MIQKYLSTTSNNMKNYVFVFDLDDTLFKEIDYVHSAFDAILIFLREHKSIDLTSSIHWNSDLKSGMIEYLLSIASISNSCTKDELLNLYRYHTPKIQLSAEMEKFITEVRSHFYKVGIITDGRSKTQRNKISALNLHWISDILISEETGFSKPDQQCYEYFEKKYPQKKYIYLADNPSKDFVTANKKGWHTIGLKDDGRNIHKQAGAWEHNFLPHKWVSSVDEIFPYLETAIFNHD